MKNEHLHVELFEGGLIEGRGLNLRLTVLFIATIFEIFFCQGLNDL